MGSNFEMQYHLVGYTQNASSITLHIEDEFGNPFYCDLDDCLEGSIQLSIQDVELEEA